MGRPAKHFSQTVELRRGRMVVSATDVDGGEYKITVFARVPMLRWLFPTHAGPFHGESTAGDGGARHKFKPLPEHKITTKPEIIATIRDWIAVVHEREATESVNLTLGASSAPAAPTSLGALRDWYMNGVAQQKEAKRQTTIGYHLGCWIRVLGGDLKLADLSPERIIPAMRELRDNPHYDDDRPSRRTEQRSPQTVNGMFVSLKLVLRAASRKGWTHPSQWEEVKPLGVIPGETQFWDEGEQRIAFEIAAADDQAHIGPDGHDTGRAVLMLGLGLYLGVRKNEAVNARWCDIDWKRKDPKTGDSAPVIKVQQRVNFRTKSRKNREIPLAAAAQKLFQSYRPSGGDGYILVPDRDYIKRGGTKGIYRYDPRAVWERVLAAAVRRKCKPITYHEMRHSFACACLTARESAEAVASWLGHRDTQMVFRHYAKFLRHPTAANLPDVSASAIAAAKPKVKAVKSGAKNKAKPKQKAKRHIGVVRR